LPLSLARGGEGGLDNGGVCNVSLHENTANFAGNSLSTFGIHIENRDRAMLISQHSGGRFAQTRRAAGHDCGSVRAKLHLKISIESKG